jgi:F-type H+-transporting ATPase subunit gamma
MANLKSLKNRIKSVKSTQKITSAMKMVAAAKLRRSKALLDANTDYHMAMEQAFAKVIRAARAEGATHPLFKESVPEKGTHLLVVISADRGLCGPFNTSIIRSTKRAITEFEACGQKVRLLCIGKKAAEVLRSTESQRMIEHQDIPPKNDGSYAFAQELIAALIERFVAGEMEHCTVLYNHFQSALVQSVRQLSLMPILLPDMLQNAEQGGASAFEPALPEMVEVLTQRFLESQCYTSLLHSNVSEQGARMSAMENATRNAGDMVRKLTLQYNRTRQATITRELIEIISGAEAV